MFVDAKPFAETVVSIVKKSSLADVPVQVCVVPNGVVIVVIAVAMINLKNN